MHEMLFCKTRPPLDPVSQSNEHASGPEDLITSDSHHAGARKQVRGNAVDLDPSEMTRKKSRTDSDDESVGSAETYTIESDGGGAGGKEQLRHERARIDVAFGVVAGSSGIGVDDERPSSDIVVDSAHLPGHADVDDVDDSPSLQIHEDSDEPDRSPRLKRATNQTLFPKNVEDSASSGGDVDYSASPLAVEGSANVNRSPDDAQELAVVDRDVSVTLNQETKKSNWTSFPSSTKRLHSEVDSVVSGNRPSTVFTRKEIPINAVGKTTQSSQDTSEIRDDNSDDDFDEDDGLRSAAASENAEVIKNKLIIACSYKKTLAYCSRINATSLLLRFILKAVIFVFFLTI